MYRIEIVDHFKNQLKKLTKKNRSLKSTLSTALLNFNKEHSISIGQEVYKIRIQGEHRGKSAGYRLYLYVLEINKILVPIAIYAKNEKENLSFKAMSEHLEKVKKELSEY